MTLVTRVLSIPVLVVLTGCFGGGGTSVVGEAGDVPVRCQGLIGQLDADACGEWGADLLSLQPEASELLITVQGGVGARCSVDFLSATGHVFSTASIPCEPPDS